MSRRTFGWLSPQSCDRDRSIAGHRRAVVDRIAERGTLVVTNARDQETFDAAHKDVVATGVRRSGTCSINDP